MSRSRTTRSICRAATRKMSRVCGCLLLLLALSLLAAPVAAATAAPNTVAQSYNAGPSVLTGMIVEPDSHSSTTVVPAKSRDIKNMLGVVVPLNGSSIVLTPPATATQQVLVAPNGRYNLLVSNQNGPVKTGDFLTISALDGIGMKAGSDQTEVIGQAVDGFSGTSGTVDTEKLSTSSGRNMTVAIGYIPVDIRLSANPLYNNNKDNGLPSSLAKAASSLVNKPVSPTRVYLSLAVLAATLFIAGSTFYGGVRGGITAIGRNPLAKRAVSRGLIQAVLFGTIVVVLGLIAVYEILI